MADEEVQEQEESPSQTEEPSQDQEGAQEQEQQEEEGGGGLSLMSPEGFIMMSIAGTIDIIGIILIFFGLDDFGITDIIAYSTIGLWMILRASGFKKPTAGKGEAAQKAAKIAKRLRWLKPLAFVGELVPYVGVLPMWTFLVYSELQT